jgi:probable addiction module antidote protein
MALETTLYDSADYLDNPDSIAAYIEAAFEDGELALITHAFGVVARAKGMSQVARDAGVTREALYKALTAEGDPKLSTFLGVLKALGMRLTARAA